MFTLKTIHTVSYIQTTGVKYKYFRAELLILLKLAKTTFGEQGFRKKKIDEIVKRVMEIDTGSAIQEVS